MEIIIFLHLLCIITSLPFDLRPDFTVSYNGSNKITAYKSLTNPCEWYSFGYPIPIKLYMDEESIKLQLTIFTEDQRNLLLEQAKHRCSDRFIVEVLPINRAPVQFGCKIGSSIILAEDLENDVIELNFNVIPRRTKIKCQLKYMASEIINMKISQRSIERIFGSNDEILITREQLLMLSQLTGNSEQVEEVYNISSEEFDRMFIKKVLQMNEEDVRISHEFDKLSRFGMEGLSFEVIMEELTRVFFVSSGRIIINNDSLVWTEEGALLGLNRMSLNNGSIEDQLHELNGQLNTVLWKIVNSMVKPKALRVVKVYRKVLMQSLLFKIDRVSSFEEHYVVKLPEMQVMKDEIMVRIERLEFMMNAKWNDIILLDRIEEMNRTLHNVIRRLDGIMFSPQRFGKPVTTQFSPNTEKNGLEVARKYCRLRGYRDVSNFMITNPKVYSGLIGTYFDEDKACDGCWVIPIIMCID